MNELIQCIFYAFSIVMFFFMMVIITPLWEKVLEKIEKLVTNKKKIDEAIKKEETD